MARHTRVLSATLALASGLWVAALLAAPIAITSTDRVVSLGAAAAYAAGANICHQRPERSFHIGGHQMPVCARCTGLYVSAAFAAPLALLLAGTMTSRRARTVIAIAALPTIVTWSLEYAGVMPFTNVARFAASLPLGFAAAWLVLGQIRPRTPPRGRMP